MFLIIQYIPVLWRVVSIVFFRKINVTVHSRSRPEQPPWCGVWAPLSARRGGGVVSRARIQIDALDARDHNLNSRPMKLYWKFIDKTPLSARLKISKSRTRKMIFKFNAGVLCHKQQLFWNYSCFLTIAWLENNPRTVNQHRRRRLRLQLLRTPTGGEGGWSVESQRGS